MDHHGALVDVLIATCSATDLRREARTLGIEHDLPGANSSTAQLADEFAAAAMRRGVLDADFFGRLLARCSEDWRPAVTAISYACTGDAPTPPSNLVANRTSANGGGTALVLVAGVVAVFCGGIAVCSNGANQVVSGDHNVVARDNAVVEVSSARRIKAFDGGGIRGLHESPSSGKKTPLFYAEGLCDFLTDREKGEIFRLNVRLDEGEHSSFELADGVEKTIALACGGGGALEWNMTIRQNTDGSAYYYRGAIHVEGLFKSTGSGCCWQGWAATGMTAVRSEDVY
jgi:uncharacterized Zn-binding protein involved in type VI secretion